MNSMHLTVCFYKNKKAASKQGIWVISVANTEMVTSIALVKPAFIRQWHYSTVCSVELILGLKGTLKYIDTWREINTWLREKRQEDESSECTACLQNEFKLWGKNKIQPILLKGIHVVGLPHLWLEILLITSHSNSLYVLITLNLVWHSALWLLYGWIISMAEVQEHCLPAASSVVAQVAPAERSRRSCNPFSSYPAYIQSSN